jgi:hypothetical protein
VRRHLQHCRTCQALCRGVRHSRSPP